MKYFAITMIIFIVGGLSILGMWMNYNNQENKTRNRAEAQRQNIENVFDGMWKIISQKAQVSSEYKNAFKEIYPELISGRYSQGDGSLMKWIKESNPEFDVSLFKDLMQSIEVERNKFSKEQTKMLDIIREHTNLITTVPSKWFITNKEPIEYVVISSTYSKNVMETRIDDDIKLF